jgi:hypothetical protein
MLEKTERAITTGQSTKTCKIVHKTQNEDTKTKQTKQRMLTITSVRRDISVRCLHFTIHMLFLLKGLSSAADAQVTQQS